METHPDSNVVHERAAAWLDRYKLGDPQEMARIEVGLMVGMCYPDAALERLQVAADLIYWGFSIDGQVDLPYQAERLRSMYCRQGAVQRLLDAPASPPLDDDPLAVAGADLLARLAVLATPAQLARISSAWRSYWNGELWAMARRADTPPPGLNEAIAIRLTSIGCQVSFAYAEIAHDYRLTDDQLADPAVRALTEMALLLTGWDNDIFSFAKELAHGVAETGLVVQLAHRHNGDLEKALPQAIKWRNRVMALFVALRVQVSRRAPDALCRYLVDLGRMISGFTHWWGTSARYKLQGLDEQHVALLARVTVGPDGNGPDPGPALPIPTIAWWWDQLDHRAKEQQ
ncbi:hypothetical protein AB0D14_32515 [Streptomyces sp. NPDC048484]|uniref:terpene synthase family protein n=1 Tax=Streptomyces sp. NPDC048484 TaxID=3155146 RepID=UPI0034245A3E